MTTLVNSFKSEIHWILNERRLEPQAVEQLPGMDCGDAIVCTAGILWVTQAGDPEDYLLQQGSAFVANSQGLVLVQALSEAAYRLSRDYKMYDWRKL